MEVVKPFKTVTRRLQSQFVSRFRGPPRSQAQPSRGENINWSVRSDGRRYGRLNPFSSSDNLAFAIERVPVKSIASHAWQDPPSLQPYSVAETFNIQPRKIEEADIGYASTTPILGQYQATLGFPDDWSWYWEYTDLRLFVVEAAFASQLKTQLVWKNGFEVDGSETAAKSFMRKWDALHLTDRLARMTSDALEYGNGYAVTIDDSEATWADTARSEMDYLVDSSGMFHVASRPLLRFKPATELYGLKQLDPRTMRIQSNPLVFDRETGDVQVEKYVQRIQGGMQLLGRSEIDLHPEQVLHLAFNHIGGGPYGYSIYRPVMFALKAYLIMHHYLPFIVQFRAEPFLQFQYGGEEKMPDGTVATKEFSEDAIRAKEAEYSNRQPGQNIHTDIWTSIKPILNDPALTGVSEIVRGQKERVLLGLGIPMSLAVLSQAGAEIKWGALNYAPIEQEAEQYHRTLEQLINEKIVPWLTNREVKVQFNPTHEEDWHADVPHLIQLFQTGIINKDYVVKRLRFPPDAVGLDQSVEAPPEEEKPEKPKRERKLITTETGKRFLVEDAGLGL